MLHFVHLSQASTDSVIATQKEKSSLVVIHISLIHIFCMFCFSASFYSLSVFHSPVVFFSISFFIISIFWLRMNHEIMHAIWIFSRPDEFPFPLIIDTAFAWLAYSRFLPSISPPARPLSSPVWARNYERLQLNIYPIQFILVYKYMCMHICLLPWTYSLLFALGRKLERTNAHENFWQEDPQGPFFPGRL